MKRPPPSSSSRARAALPSESTLVSPLRFEPRLEERVWGGTTLGRYGKAVAAGQTVGESWEISDVEQRPSIVASGAPAGGTLRELMLRHAPSILGQSQAPPHREGGVQFPLLVKLLDARDDLSIQVHPSDDDLHRAGKSGSGKTEAWVILEAQPGARIIHGLAPGVDRGALLDRLEALHGGPLPEGEDAALFRWVEVRRGDIVFVPAGTIHAVGSGVLLIEVQQTSDVTYRIYDWGRPGKDGKPRDLHLQEARTVSERSAPPCPFSRVGDGVPGASFQPLLAREESQEFQIEALTLGPGTSAGRVVQLSTGSGASAEFHILAGFEGTATLASPSGGAEISAGQVVLLPAALGRYEIEAESAQATVLRFLGRVR